MHESLTTVFHDQQHVFKEPKRAFAKERFGNLILETDLAETIERLMIMLKHRESLVKRNFEAPWAVLFNGPPGCVKTSLAEYIADSMDFMTSKKTTTDIVSSSMGETGKNVYKAFAEASSGCLILDEFDAISMKRSSAEKGAEQEANRIVASILQVMDSRRKPELFIATTNRLNDIDGAILRRFSLIVNFPDPTIYMKRALRDDLCKKHGFDKKTAPDKIFAGLNSMAEVKNVITNKLMSDFLESIGAS